MQQSLYLVRHAHALDGPDDPQRPLSPKGKKQVARICEALKGKGLINPSLVWQSPYRRAKETARHLIDGLGLSVSVVTVEGITPFDDPPTISDSIGETVENLMVVGHEPHLSGLASLLLSGNPDLGYVVFSKSSILNLTRLKVGNKSTPWQIDWHLNHKFFK